MICRLCNARVAPADGAAHRAECPGGIDFHAIAEELYEAIDTVSGSDDIATMEAILRKRFARPAEPAEGWRPIAEAAKSGLRILVWLPELGVQTAYFGLTGQDDAKPPRWIILGHGDAYSPIIFRALPVAPGEQRPEPSWMSEPRTMVVCETCGSKRCANVGGTNPCPGFDSYKAQRPEGSAMRELLDAADRRKRPEEGRE